MRRINTCMGDFRVWLEAQAAQGLAGYVRPDGMVALYHYAKLPYGSQPKREITSQPKRIGQNPFTRNDLKASTVPRTFFYIDLNDRENFFTGSPLYKTLVPASKIYDLLEDPLGFKEQIRQENNGVLNITMLVDMAEQHPEFDGIYYKPGFHVVAWFKPLTLQLVDEQEERQAHVSMDDGGSKSRAS